MIGVASVLAVVVLVWALAVVGFNVGAVRAVTRFFAARPPADLEGMWPRIAILRPCEGLDPGLEENLLSTVTAAYAGDRAVFLCVPSAEDPAFEVVQRVRLRARTLSPKIPVEVVVTRITTTANRKAEQLARGLSHTDAPIVVQADSSVRIADDTLPALVGALLDDPTAGASYAPPLEISPQSVGDHASVALLTTTPHAFFALATLSADLKGPKLLAGKLIAHHRSALDSIGGFEAQIPYLGEDFELSRRLFEAGRSLAVSRVPVGCTDQGRPFFSLVRRYARWAMVVRRQRPFLYATYFLFLGATPLLLLSGLAVFTLAPLELGGPALAAALLSLAIRMQLARELRARYGLTTTLMTTFGASMLGETLIVLSAARGLITDYIEWRGHRYRVGSRGALEPRTGDR